MGRLQLGFQLELPISDYGALRNHGVNYGDNETHGYAKLQLEEFLEEGRSSKSPKSPATDTWV